MRSHIFYFHRQPHNLLSKALNELLKRNGCSIENMDEMLNTNG